MFSIDAFFQNTFGPHLTEFLDREPTDMDGWLYVETRSHTRQLLCHGLPTQSRDVFPCRSRCPCCIELSPAQWAFMCPFTCPLSWHAKRTKMKKPCALSSRRSQSQGDTHKQLLQGLQSVHQWSVLLCPAGRCNSRDQVWSMSSCLGAETKQIWLKSSARKLVPRWC